MGGFVLFCSSSSCFFFRILLHIRIKRSVFTSVRCSCCEQIKPNNFHTRLNKSTEQHSKGEKCHTTIATPWDNNIIENFENLICESHQNQNFSIVITRYLISKCWPENKSEKVVIYYYFLLLYSLHIFVVCMCVDQWDRYESTLFLLMLVFGSIQRRPNFLSARCFINHIFS